MFATAPVMIVVVPKKRTLFCVKSWNNASQKRLYNETLTEMSCPPRGVRRRRHRLVIPRRACVASIDEISPVKPSQHHQFVHFNPNTRLQHPTPAQATTDAPSIFPESEDGLGRSEIKCLPEAPKQKYLTTKSHCHGEVEPY